MRQFYDQTMDCLRAFRAHAIICLAMLQAIAFLLSPLGPSHIQSDAPGISLAATQALCVNDISGGDRTHSDHHQHECVLCATSGRDHWSGALALLAVVIVALSPSDDESSRPIIAKDSAARPSLGLRITFTRGPPAYFS